ncbi:MAG: LysR family transcriptional regulator [Pseudomonadota bacterium]
MNLTALQTFITIVDTGSLVRAASALNVTQSTVTARLRTLEDELGQQLLHRHKSGSTLTPAGTKLLRYARVMEGLWRQARYATALPEGLASVCAFGCEADLWNDVGQAIFEGVVAVTPELAVTVVQGSATELDKWLADGRVDMILSSDPAARHGQTAHRLAPDRLVLCSDRPDTPTHADPRYIFVDYGDTFRRAHDEAYHQAGVARIGFDTPLWALAHILAHGGSAYLPETVAAPHIATGALHALPDAPVFHREKSLVVTDSAARTWAWFDAFIRQFDTAPAGS